ncbi:MAG: hypothetical protein GX074_02430 [Erysipelothrix sp.]|nr:hypothetical protein [Erysipelothrix sp.]
MRSRLIQTAFLSALLIVSKELLSVLPNVEIVTLLIMAYTYVVGVRGSIYIAIIFTLIQAFIYPPHLWILTYFIIWPLLVIISGLLKKVNASNLSLAIAAAIFGLSFGAVDSLVNILIYGPQTFYAMWLRGLPWDIIHAISNYLTVLILFKPIKNSLEKIIN